MIMNFHSGKRRRKGMVTIEHVMATAVFMVMAGLTIRESFKLLRLLHHIICTLVGWPVL